MKKTLLAFILILTLVTSLIKNSTKKIEDKIFAINENIRTLKIEFGDELLEHNYLSSPRKLTQHQSQYFEKDLVKIDITRIKNIIINGDNLEITDFTKKIQSNE
tara:strand:- start:159 stop:470 length:312 start_codon:yes stop_codon:yes gene_type:complete